MLPARRYQRYFIAATLLYASALVYLSYKQSIQHEMHVLISSRNTSQQAATFPCDSSSKKTVEASRVRIKLAETPAALLDALQQIPDGLNLRKKNSTPDLFSLTPKFNKGLPKITKLTLVSSKDISRKPVKNGHMKSMSDVNDLSAFSSVFVKKRDFIQSLNKNRGESGTVKTMSTKMIYYYNTPQWFLTRFDGCEVSACIVTKDPAHGKQADAVLFHVPYLSSLPAFPRRPEQVWIGMGLESPLLCQGGYKRPEWRWAFNLSMTYRVDSDLFLPYGYLVYRKPPPDRNYTSIALGKTKNAAWFVSNCHAPSQRDLYVNRLKQHIDVDVYGRCGSLECPRGKGQECDKLLNTKYRFYLAFENSLCHDYVTEKFFNIFRNLHVIPVVRGGANYTKYFPPGTFIDAGDFETPKDLAQHLRHLAGDTDTYAAMLRRKDHFFRIYGQQGALCGLCKMLHSDKRAKTVRDFPQWFETNMCHEPSDLSPSH